MKAARFVFCLILLASFLPIGTALATEFDPYLHQKAQDYTDWLMQWNSTGLGGVSDVLFTDGSRTEIQRLWGAGDSGDWTGTYLVTQAMRFVITGEQQALDEVERIAQYMHVLHDITGDPGYLARYAGPNEAPWNVENLGGDNFYEAEGEYEGNFWLGHNVRDKYMTWFWGMTWAYEVLEGHNETLRQTIREDMSEILHTLIDNDWTIIDPWGDIYSAAAIGIDLRLSFLAQAVQVTGEEYFTQKMNEEYEANQNIMWVTMNAWFNRYQEYYAFINNYSNIPNLFRLWPDRARLEHIFQVWKLDVRSVSNDGHNPFFDSVYTAICLRLGTCDQTELDAIAEDIQTSLEAMWEAPNYQREVTISEMPLDPFSVWADEFLAEYPWIEELTGFDIDPQTLDAHEIDDRCWCSVMWERSPYHISCDYVDDPAHVAHGVDYLIAYWMAVYYGIVAGDGPYGDDDPTDDDTIDDDTLDDDTVDDDTTDDDTGDDDDTITDDDAIDDDVVDDDDLVDDDDQTDDDAAPVGDDDDDDDDGCGC